MTTKECVTFARENPVCFLATSDAGQPHVRTVLLWSADDTGFYFILLSPKKVCRQLKANPKAEVCFYNHASDLSAARQLRVAGRMELITDAGTHARAVKERSFLEGMIGQPLAPITEVYRLSACDAHFWTLPDGLKEDRLEHVTF